ncbi:hypothetical protein PR048_022722 [Dryococelus australis]|uniref:Uncharacterized protein n=1 Tax=Dryococelus australis TaxID=614101 RepID=A0ABQ9GS39_9NEOP|nr:hypothetical protein PR048_022722 [Dryococelus australis]
MNQYFHGSNKYTSLCAVNVACERAWLRRDRYAGWPTNIRLARNRTANPITVRCGATANEHTAEAPVYRGLRILAYRSLNSRNYPIPSNRRDLDTEASYAVPYLHSCTADLDRRLVSPKRRKFLFGHAFPEWKSYPDGKNLPLFLAPVSQSKGERALETFNTSDPIVSLGSSPALGVSEEGEGFSEVSTEHSLNEGDPRENTSSGTSITCENPGVEPGLWIVKESSVRAREGIRGVRHYLDKHVIVLPGQTCVRHRYTRGSALPGQTCDRITWTNMRSYYLDKHVILGVVEVTNVYREAKFAREKNLSQVSEFSNAQTAAVKFKFPAWSFSVPISSRGGRKKQIVPPCEENKSESLARSPSHLPELSLRAAPGNRARVVISSESGVRVPPTPSLLAFTTLASGAINILDGDREQELVRRRRKCDLHPRLILREGPDPPAPHQPLSHILTAKLFLLFRAWGSFLNTSENVLYPSRRAPSSSPMTGPESGAGELITNMGSYLSSRGLMEFTNVPGSLRWRAIRGEVRARTLPTVRTAAVALILATRVALVRGQCEVFKTCLDYGRTCCIEQRWGGILIVARKDVDNQAAHVSVSPYNPSGCSPTTQLVRHQSLQPEWLLTDNPACSSSVPTTRVAAHRQPSLFVISPYNPSGCSPTTQLVRHQSLQPEWLLTDNPACSSSVPTTRVAAHRQPSLFVISPYNPSGCSPTTQLVRHQSLQPEWLLTDNPACSSSVPTTRVAAHRQPSLFVISPYNPSGCSPTTQLVRHQSLQPEWLLTDNPACSSSVPTTRVAAHRQPSLFVISPYNPSGCSPTTQLVRHQSLQPEWLLTDNPACSSSVPTTRVAAHRQPSLFVISPYNPSGCSPTTQLVRHQSLQPEWLLTDNPACSSSVPTTRVAAHRQPSLFVISPYNPSGCSPTTQLVRHQSLQPEWLLTDNPACSSSVPTTRVAVHRQPSLFVISPYNPSGCSPTTQLVRHQSLQPEWLFTDNPACSSSVPTTRVAAHRQPSLFVISPYNPSGCSPTTQLVRHQSLQPEWLLTDNPACSSSVPTTRVAAHRQPSLFVISPYNPSGCSPTTQLVRHQPLRNYKSGSCLALFLRPFHRVAFVNKKYSCNDNPIHPISKDSSVTSPDSLIVILMADSLCKSPDTSRVINNSIDKLFRMIYGRAREMTQSGNMTIQIPVSASHHPRWRRKNLNAGNEAEWEEKVITEVKNTSQKERMVTLLTSHLGELGSIPECLLVGIVPDDAARRRVFSGISRFPCPGIPALLHTHITYPSSAVKKSILRAAKCFQKDITTSDDNMRTHLLSPKLCMVLIPAKRDNAEVFMTRTYPDDRDRIFACTRCLKMFLVQITSDEAT